MNRKKRIEQLEKNVLQLTKNLNSALGFIDTHSDSLKRLLSVEYKVNNSRVTQHYVELYNEYDIKIKEIIENLCFKAGQTVAMCQKVFRGYHYPHIENTYFDHQGYFYNSAMEQEKDFHEMSHAKYHIDDIYGIIADERAKKLISTLHNAIMEKKIIYS